jgi:CarboxypepD_reg-like domain/TonB-dependent Receptor Plug Domain
LKTIYKAFLFLFILVNANAIAQTARIKGVILDENNKPLGKVNITDGINKTTTNENGFYELTVPASKKITITYSCLSFPNKKLNMNLKPNEDFEFNPVMNNNAEEISEVVIVNNRRRVQGITNIDPAIISKIPGANAGVEGILKTLPGVYSNNELSTQYAVRGGNYDENLVYVNEIEVYRPFLVRSGQQEGLSFTNTDLSQNVDFSAGGFQAKYGDKLSSVLDITYRMPRKFGATADASFLGGSLSVDAVSIEIIHF